MPDPNPANHYENAPRDPFFREYLVGSHTIDASYEWHIDRVGRIPQGTWYWVIPYKEEYQGMELLNLINLMKTGGIQRMFSPQPSARCDHLSESAELGIMPSTFVQPESEYIIAVQAFNEAGESNILGNFDITNGTIYPVKTLSY